MAAVESETPGASMAYRQRVEDVVAALATHANQGLTDAEARMRLERDVAYLPFLQHAFGTVALSARDWVVCVAVASSVLWLREASKLIARGWR